jgi:CheY-like chemotaxis protein
VEKKQIMSHRPVDIVVADDNEMLLSVLSETLEECGYSVRSAVSGLEALTEIRRRAPDILLSDLNMPCMSGFELLSIVRRRHPKIRATAMSASYPNGVVPQGVAADAFYEKDATSVAQLLLIVNAVRNEPESQLLRVSTPVWIPKPSIVPAGESSAPFACPECLRAYPCAIDERDSPRHWSCPYCLYRVQLAFCPAATEADEQPLVYYYS